ncbi:MAG: coiled-coil domain-containing protein [Planctomycetota bacterium]
MSTLTKILIVLLTVASIFLCGVVVTYVANAENYKEKYKGQQRALSAAKENAKNLQEQLKEKIDENDRQKKQLNDKIAALENDLTALKGNTQIIEREKSELMLRVDNFGSYVEAFTETNTSQQNLLKATLDELDKTKTNLVKRAKEIKELSAYLDEKMAIIEVLESDKKRLVEQKTELQNSLDNFLLAGGRQAGEPVPVTPELTTIKTVTPLAETIDLKGLVTEVDLKNSAASISLGKVDGVKVGMIFHVTRGDEFIRDILIIDVDEKEAVGVLQLGDQNPKNGDTAATNF